MKILLVGGGSAGKRHLVSLIGLGVPPADITLVERPEFAAATGHPFTEMTVHLGTQVWAQAQVAAFDAVVIATPAVHHADWVRQAIRAGVPFFVEKPAVTRVSALPEADWATDVAHVVGYQLRFHPAVRLLQHAYPSGPARFTVNCDMATWPGRDYESPLLECSHEIDLALHLLGRASLQRVHHGRHGWTLVLRHVNGVSEVRINPAAPEYLREWDITSVVAGTVVVRMTQPEQVQAYGHLEEMAHFLSVARGEVKSRSSLAHARRVVEICDEAVRRVA